MNLYRLLVTGSICAFPGYFSAINTILVTLTQRFPHSSHNPSVSSHSELSP